MSTECCSPEKKDNVKNVKKDIWKLVSALIVVVPFEILSFFSIHLPLWFELPVFLIIIIFFGRDVFKSGFKSLAKLNFSDINLLMTIAIVGAVYLLELEEAAIIVILFALGETLEKIGIARSQSALENLVNTTPKSALLKGTTEKTPIEQIKVGAIVIIKPGDHIPLDGLIVEGNSMIDETVITGEPLPKNKHKDDVVYAGTVNGHGYFEMQVTKEAKDTTLSKIIELTYQSAEKKSKSQQFIEKFATYYTPAVMVLASLVVIIPVFVFQQPFTKWFTEALTILLISCPCALVISTPITIFSAIGNATQKGVLIKGGKFLEEMGKIKAIAFDKTRTLTKGEPIVADVVPFNSVTKEELLACVAGAELQSEHPVAKSIITKAEQEGLDHHPFINFKAVMGKGLQAECTVCVDKHHCIGTLKFITEEHAVGEEIVKQVEAFEKQGKTTIVISDNDKVTGVISVTDEIRAESKSMVQALSKLGVYSVILTGDNTSSAKYVAEQIGISEVNAELLPDGKLKEITRLLKEHKHVAMIGDGINDAPALATASVGIAMGAVGSDVAIENADIALMNNNLMLVPYLIELGKKSVQTIRFNTALAVLVKLSFLALAFTGRSNLALAIIADVGVTIFVVMNSLRLFQFKSNTY